jgi:hypothetical protein
MAAATTNTFTPERNYGQNPAPGRTAVKLDAAVNALVGTMLVTVSGYGRLPAAANAATGRMAGIVENGADNSLGAQGDLTAYARSMVVRLQNDAGNACSQATVGSLVYASDNLTVSTASGDGPKAGKLIGFYSDDPQGRPCEVALICNTP